MLPKLSRNPKIKSQDAASRRQRPDERTRGSHAPKRVAICHYQAAETRPKPRFRGNPVLSGDQFSWESCVGTLPPSAPINTPCSATYRASRGRARGPNLGFRFSSCSLDFLFTFVISIFPFCKLRGDDVLMEEGDLLVLRVTIGVSFAFPSLLNKSNRGSFFIMLCSFILVDSCVSQFLFSSIVISL